jgi:hypothetical protein
MTSSKHQQGPGNRGGAIDSGDTPRPPDDLSRNPGIGSSKGIHSRTGTNPEALEGENTSEGDTLNDANPQGGVTPGQTGRANK